MSAVAATTAKPFNLVADTSSSTAENAISMKLNGTKISSVTNFPTTDAWSMGINANVGDNAVSLAIEDARLVRVTEDLTHAKRALGFTFTVEAATPSWYSHKLTVNYHNDGATKADYSDISNIKKVIDITDIDIFETTNRTYAQNYNNGNGLTNVSRLTRPGYHTETKNSRTDKAWKIGSKTSTRIVNDYGPEGGTTADMAAYLGVYDQLRAGDVTIDLYPVFYANSYKIKFDPNTAQNGQGTMSGASAIYDESMTLPACTFTNSAGDSSKVRFAGWNTEPDGTGTAYADRASVKNLTMADNGTVTLYAQWEFANTIAMKYDNSVDNGSMDYVSPANPKADTTVYAEQPTITVWAKPGETIDETALKASMSSDEATDWSQKWTWSGSVETIAKPETNTIEVDRQKYILDLNGKLDDQYELNTAGMGTVNIWINGVQWQGQSGASDGKGNYTDFYAMLKYGARFKATLSDTAEGHALTGITLYLHSSKVTEKIEDRQSIESTLTDMTSMDFCFRTIPKTAFAVYSTDDNSLDFYKRYTVPSVGDTFNGKTVTEVYTDFENIPITATGDYWENYTVNTPWFGRRTEIKTITAVDDGIVLKQIRYYFYGCNAVESVDLRKLDVTQVTDANAAFLLCTQMQTLLLPAFSSRLSYAGDLVSNCKSLTVLDLSESDLSGLNVLTHLASSDRALEEVIFPSNQARRPSHITNFSYAFANCKLLREVENLSDAFWQGSASVTLDSAFSGCRDLIMDCSRWNVENVMSHTDFALSSAGIIEPDWPVG